MEKELVVKRIVQAVTIVLAMILVGLLLWDYLEKKKNEEYYDIKYVEAMPLREQKQELEKQLVQVKREYQVKINGKGTLSFLCMGLTEDIYAVIYPQMKEYGFVGMLAVSENALPQAEGCMDAVKVKELLDAGWCLCLHWSGEGQLEEWLTDMQRRLEAQELEMPVQIYFERETYRAEYDELLVKHGLEVIVHHQEQGLPTLATKTEEGIWHIGAWGWNQTNARSSMDKASEVGAGLVFTIGAKYYYDEEQFPKMLKVLADYEEAESLYVMDVADAHSYREETEETRAVFQKELEAEIERLKAEIETVDKQILEFYGSE